jgi:hypothetical protein
MSAFSKTVFMIGNLALGGCAIAPTTENVTGFSPQMIVRKCRCEMREAVKDKLAVTLIAFGDAKARQTGHDLLNDRIDVSTVNLLGLDNRLRGYISKYARSAVAYNFSLGGTEVNNVGTDGGLLHTFLNGTRSLGFSAGMDRSRQNVITINQSDTFVGLLRDIKDDYCLDKNTEKNYFYPITGNIGFARMLDSFIDLSEFSNLAGPTENTQGAPTVGYSLEFSTTITGSITPKIELSAIRDEVRLSSASIGTTLSRTDVHKLIFAFARPTDGRLEADDATIFRGRFSSREGTPEQRRAQEEVDRQILRYELNNRPAAVIINQSLF